MVTVKEARKNAGMSQMQAAVALGISMPTYAKYERQPEVMSLRMAHKLADTFGVEFGDLALFQPEGSPS